LDTDGLPIQAHGGGILRVNEKFYWYGENKSLPNRPGKHHVDVIGVNGYVSSDLFTWKNLGLVLPAVKDDPEHDLHPSHVLERPKVLHHKATGKFVMWMHIDRTGYQYARVGVAVSERPEGPFTYLRSFRPHGQESRDMTVFQDIDGSAFLIHSSEGNATLHITRLSDDYLDVTGQPTRQFVGKFREAPCVVRHGAKLFMVTSGCTGWSANPASYATADHVLGPWTDRGNPCVGTDAQVAKTFDSQGTFILPVEGRPGRFVFLADRWNREQLSDSRYVWLPMTIEREKLVIEWCDEWNILEDHPT
jgi:hypothetical protein